MISNSSRDDCNIFAYMLDKKKDVNFDKKIITPLFTGYFEADLLDTVLVHSWEGDWPVKFEVSMSAVGDYDNGAATKKKRMVVFL